jgi:hypothetical protein
MYSCIFLYEKTCNPEILSKFLFTYTKITVNKVGTVVVHWLHKSDSANSSESSQKVPVRLYQRPILEAAMGTKNRVGTE